MRIAMIVSVAIAAVAVVSLIGLSIARVDE
jgi:hypothetical protein